MLQVAAFLAATLIDANPEYADQKRFGKGADAVRQITLDYARTVRSMSKKAGYPLLYKIFEAAGAKTVKTAHHRDAADH